MNCLFTISAAVGRRGQWHLVPLSLALQSYVVAQLMARYAVERKMHSGLAEQFIANINNHWRPASICFTDQEGSFQPLTSLFLSEFTRSNLRP
ncbi:hypothetical protein M513_00357 [Trichuris suis]|uniref:Uncharacterized protein n=1 Tax=Trichuris suis TaxID=68888 RepID=A0A085MN68_9BILA|nr:hypothetical protein M513_00357 [Trichuris suis]